MSTSIALVTCADVSSDLRMWSAIPRRIADIGSKFSPTVDPACAGGAAGAAAGAGGAGAAGAGAAGAAGAGSTGAAGSAVAAVAAPWPPCSMKDLMSFLVTRPPDPEPGTCDGSIPCSAAILATTGEMKDLPLSDADGAAMLS